MKRIFLLFLGMVILVASAATLAGCIAQSTPPSAVIPTPSPTPDNTTLVHVDGFFTVDGPARSDNPVTTMVTVEMTNTGDFDAKNVKADVQLIFNGDILDEETLYFGTVKVGMPIKKEFVMKAQYSVNDWKKYKSASYEGMELNIDNVIGDNLRNSYPNIANQIIPIGNSTIPKYKKGDIIADKLYSNTAVMVIGYNETPSGNYYLLEYQERMTGNNIQAHPMNEGMWIASSSPNDSMEINIAEWRYPVLIDTYSI